MSKLNYSETTSYLLELLKAAVTNTEPSTPSKDVDWDELFIMAENHRIIATLYFALNKLPYDVVSKIPQWNTYTFAYKQQLVDDANKSNEINIIHDALSKKGIDHIFLKGAVTRYMYPETAMRIMNDIDVLYRGSSTEDVESVFAALGYKVLDRGPKDIAFGRESVRVKVEMQTALIDEGYENWYNYLVNVWQECKPSSGHSFIMSKEMFYLYHIIHLAKHTRNGGIGLMHIIDTWMIARAYKDMNWDYVEEELEYLGLYKFHDVTMLLNDYWFDSYEPTDYEMETIEIVSSFIFTTSAFGNKTQQAANDVVAEGDEKISLRKKLFPGKTVIANYYGSKAANRTWLRPWYWLKLNVRRIFRNREKMKSSFRSFSSVSATQIERTKLMFDRLGL